MSVVYMIEMVGHDLVKIGKTTNVTARLATLQTGCPHELQIYALFCGRAECNNADLESELHAKYAHLRTRGEWFTFAPELRALKDALDPPHSDNEPPEIDPVQMRSAFAESPEHFCEGCGHPIGHEPGWQGVESKHFVCPEVTS